MNRLVKNFKNKKEEEKTLICYFPVGDPSFDSLHIAGLYLEGGVDVLEIGIPVSNPYLDGKLVADSMERALSVRTPLECIEIIVDIRKKYPEAVLQAMCYKQLFDTLDWDTFNKYVVRCELDGLLVADANLEEQLEIRSKLHPNVSLLSFLPFNYSDVDVAYLQEHGEGYVFLQAVDGVTGMRDSLDERLYDKIKEAKEALKDVPVCAGFGISKPEHCRQVYEMGADGVIIGSAVLRKIQEGDESLVSFVKECKKALR